MVFLSVCCSVRRGAGLLYRVALLAGVSIARVDKEVNNLTALFSKGEAGCLRVMGPTRAGGVSTACIGL